MVNTPVTPAEGYVPATQATQLYCMQQAVPIAQEVRSFCEDGMGLLQLAAGVLGIVHAGASLFTQVPNQQYTHVVQGAPPQQVYQPVAPAPVQAPQPAYAPAYAAAPPPPPPAPAVPPFQGAHQTVQGLWI